MPPAAAAACSDEQGIFVKDTSATHASMDRNNFDVVDRGMAAKSSCSYVDAVSTVHIRSVTDAARQVETGWVERYNSGTGHKFDWFWEAQNGNVVLGGFDIGNVSISCCGAHSWKVLLVNGYAWRFYHHAGNTGTFNDIGTGVAWDEVGFTEGIPEGETNRRGGNCTGMSDDHYTLQFTGGNGVTGDWNNNTIDHYQNNPNWSWDRVSDTEYQTTRDFPC